MSVSFLHCYLDSLFLIPTWDFFLIGYTFILYIKILYCVKEKLGAGLYTKPSIKNLVYCITALGSSGKVRELIRARNISDEVAIRMS